MQEWKCMVRMPSNFIQTFEVDAYTRSDAITYIESSTGGKCINATPQYRSIGDDSDSETNSSSIDGGGILFLLVIVFCIAAWKYLLLFGGLALLLWILWKNW